MKRFHTAMVLIIFAAAFLYGPALHAASSREGTRTAVSYSIDRGPEDSIVSDTYSARPGKQVQRHKTSKKRYHKQLQKSWFSL